MRGLDTCRKGDPGARQEATSDVGALRGWSWRAVVAAVADHRAGTSLGKPFGVLLK